ncbi:choline phosphate cytidylyltransferase [Conglomerata obtusa]
MQIPILNVFIDGCFDLFHYGHANALRQARSHGSTLTAAICSSTSTAIHKNTPIMTDLERYAVVSACKWVTKTVLDAPYNLDLAFVRNCGCNLVVHGDDQIVDANGINCYDNARAENVYKEFVRTLGVSTSEIIGRMLYRERLKKKTCLETRKYQEELMILFSRGNESINNDKEGGSNKLINGNEENADGSDKIYCGSDDNKNNSNNTINQNNKNNENSINIIKKGKIIYIDGSFDLYHAGHTAIIKEAKLRGGYLIIGIHSDLEILKVKNEEPIMTYNERKLCLLSNKYIDEIIDEAPFSLTEDFIKEHGINEIVCGTENVKLYKGIENVVGIETEFSYLSCKIICDRILRNFLEYEKKVKKNAKINL